MVSLDGKERSVYFREALQNIRELVPDLSKVPPDQMRRLLKARSEEEKMEIMRSIPELEKTGRYQTAVIRLFFGHRPADNTLPIKWEDTPFGGITAWSSWAELKQLVEADSRGVLTSPAVEEILNQRIEDLRARNAGTDLELATYRDILVKCRIEGIEAAFSEKVSEEKQRRKESDEWIRQHSGEPSIFVQAVCPNCGKELLVFGGGVCPYCGEIFDLPPKN